MPSSGSGRWDDSPLFRYTSVGGTVTDSLDGFPNITGEQANLILMDMGQGVDPAKSRRLTYGPEERAFYAKIKADWDRYRATHPDAVLDVQE